MTRTFNEVIWNIISSGLPLDHEAKILRKTVMVNIFSLLGAVTVFTMAFIVLAEGNTTLFIIDIAIGFSFFSVLQQLRKTKDPAFPAKWGTLGIASFFLFLIGNSGTHQTFYMLWSFTYPIFSIALLGNRKGFQYSSIFLFLAILIFLAGGHLDSVTIYPAGLSLRFIAVYSIITIFAYTIDRAREISHRALAIVNRDLKKSLEDVKILSGLIPICSSCKNIRDDKGYWIILENFIQTHSEAQFSHGICPDCTENLYGEETWYRDFKNQGN